MFYIFFFCCFLGIKWGVMFELDNLNFKVNGFFWMFEKSINIRNKEKNIKWVLNVNYINFMKLWIF